MNDLKAVMRKARSAYHSQKYHAKQRGIQWRFTFAEWVQWWGDDFHRRGSGQFNLQMQRINDEGPYASWNVRKGVPAQNSSTYSNMHANRKSAEAARRHQETLNKAEAAPSHDDMTEDEEELREMFAIRTASSLRIAY